MPTIPYPIDKRKYYSILKILVTGIKHLLAALTLNFFVKQLLEHQT